eukprot:6468241-Amphidinium_carterae.1
MQRLVVPHVRPRCPNQHVSSRMPLADSSLDKSQPPVSGTMCWSTSGSQRFWCPDLPQAGANMTSPTSDLRFDAREPPNANNDKNKESGPPSAPSLCNFFHLTGCQA